MSFKFIVIDNDTSRVVMQEDNVLCMVGGYCYRETDEICGCKEFGCGSATRTQYVGAIGAAEESIKNIKANIGYDSSLLDGVAFGSLDELLENMRRKGL